MIESVSYAGWKRTGTVTTESCRTRDSISIISSTEYPGEDSQKNGDFGLYLCRNHHTEGPEAVHNNREKDLFLQQIAQGRFERLYNHEKWMEIFGKNYLIM